MPQYIVDPCIRALGILRPGKPLLLIRVPLASIGNFGTLPLCIDPRCTIYRLHLKYMYRVQIVIKDVQIRMMLPALINATILARLTTWQCFHWNFRRNMLFDSRKDFLFTSECASVFDVESRSEPSSSLSNGYHEWASPYWCTRETVMLTTNSHLEVKLVHERTSTCDFCWFSVVKTIKSGFRDFPVALTQFITLFNSTAIILKTLSIMVERLMDGWSKALTASCIHY